MAEWYQPIEEELQSSLELAGLGNQPRDIVRILRSWYPDISLSRARELARAATSALAAAAQVEGRLSQEDSRLCSGTPAPGIPQGRIYVDAEITYRNPRTGREERRFMRADIPAGATFADIQDYVDSFIAWIDNRYGLPVSPNQVTQRIIAILCSERE